MKNKFNLIGGKVMKIKTLIVDNDKSCINILKNALHNFPFIEVIGEINDPKDAIGFLQNNSIDLLFLDIEMGEIHGIDLAKHIKSMYPHILIIFVTGHPGFALEGYEVYPIDFIVKPINIFRLEKALNKVKEIKSATLTETQHKIGMNVSGGIQMVNVNDIIYIEKQGRRISVVCKSGDILYSNESMQTLENIFLAFDFYRPHQSFLVPIQKIKAMYPDKYTRSYILQLIDCNVTIPVSRNKYSELKEILEKQTKGLTIH